MTSIGFFSVKHILLISLIFSSQVSSQNIRLSAVTDSASYRIGEWVNLRVEGEFPEGTQSITPAVKDSLGTFELLAIESGESAREAGIIRQSWILRLIAFDTGSVTIPAVAFDYTVPGKKEPLRAFSNPVAVTLLGVSVDPNGDIKDIKPPLDAPWLFEDLVPYLVVLGVLLIAAVAYYFYRKYKRRRDELADLIARTIPPHEVALFALRALEEKKLWQQGLIKEYYSEATQIVRLFFEARLGIIALEMTSDEILEQLKLIPEVQPLGKEIRQFLLTADLVKFAKYGPSPEENQHELEWAYEIVRALIPRPLVEEPKEAVNAR